MRRLEPGRHAVRGGGHRGDGGDASQLDPVLGARARRVKLLPSCSISPSADAERLGGQPAGPWRAARARPARRRCRPRRRRGWRRCPRRARCRAVSPPTMLTSAGVTPSSSAAIWASVVSSPWPCDGTPVKTVTRPAASARIGRALERAHPGQLHVARDADAEPPAALASAPALARQRARSPPSPARGAGPPGSRRCRRSRGREPR